MVTTRPKIAFAINQVARFSQNPGPIHWDGVKRILSYLDRTTNYGLRFFCGGPNSGTLVAYSDSDYVDESETRKLTNCQLNKRHSSTFIGGYSLNSRTQTSLIGRVDAVEGESQWIDDVQRGGTTMILKRSGNEDYFVNHEIRSSNGCFKWYESVSNRSVGAIIKFCSNSNFYPTAGPSPLHHYPTSGPSSVHHYSIAVPTLVQDYSTAGSSSVQSYPTVDPSSLIHHKQLKNQARPSIYHSTITEIQGLPLQNMAELERYEILLRDEEIRRQLVGMISSIGGKGFKDAIERALAAVASDKVLRDVNWPGRKRKDKQKN
ncbi:hypothetical protein GHT06_009019 [Daphnia sinensis]|uniref:DUF4806 domain-containing protein n=1 Tax=Daphnia sinensis TaxID=1820382 RepID=A0AAD5L2C0_9CRUS|nr:hypothetical protein GHT06_009019 [Daphnia sinensis]